MKDYFKQVDIPVFVLIIAIMLLAIAWGIASPEGFSGFVTTLNDAIYTNFGWLYVIIIAAALVFAIWGIFGKYAHVKLGKDDDKPEYSTFSWIAMLFSCGVGIGYLFYGVAEPMYHFMETPYLATPGSPQALPVAVAITTFHWGLAPWSLYVVGGLGMAYYTFRLGKPMTVANSLIGLLGEERIAGPWGGVVNFIAAFATIGGIGTTLGLAVMQLNFGFNYITGVTITPTVSYVLLLVLIGGYITSALTGLNRGIKVLSQINVWLAFLIMFFILFVGPTRSILNTIVDSLGHYIQYLPFMTFWLDSGGDTPWLNWWTIFYWGWWISWVPFVGAFIARISKGRTIREYVVGVVLVPVLAGLIWFATLGGAGIYAQVNGIAPIWEAMQSQMEASIFVLLESYPLGRLVMVIVFINMLTFTVTSADSASFVVAMNLSKGVLEPKFSMKIIVGILIGALAVVLLATGGLKALQTLSIITALPFSLAIVAMMVSMYITLKKEESS